MYMSHTQIIKTADFNFEKRIIQFKNLRFLNLTKLKYKILLQSISVNIGFPRFGFLIG